MMKVKIFTVTLIVFEGDCQTLHSFIPLWLLFRCYSVYFCIFVMLSSWNFHPKMAAALPKRRLVAVTRKAAEFRLLVFYTLWADYRHQIIICFSWLLSSMLIQVTIVSVYHLLFRTVSQSLKVTLIHLWLEIMLSRWSRNITFRIFVQELSFLFNNGMTFCLTRISAVALDKL